MAWVKLDDHFPDHPKVVAVGPAAGWLYVCGLAYCSRYLTDGFIPQDQVRRLADVGGARKHVESLVSVGLWERTDGGYLVHDYLEYNPSRERVLATREARAAAGAAGGKQRASNLLDSGYGAATNNDATLRKQNRTPYPLTRTPTPTPSPTASLATASEEENGEPNGSDAAASARVGLDDQTDETDEIERPNGEGRIYVLVDAWAVATKRRPAQLRGRERKETADAFRSIAGEAGPADIAACAAFLRSDPFWQEPGKLTARKLAQTIPEWIEAGRPESVLPRGSPNGPAPALNPDDYKGDAYLVRRGHGQ